MSPQPDSIYSDGRSILLRWEKEALDETFDVSVIAEPVEKTTTPFILVSLVFIITQAKSMLLSMLMNLLSDTIHVILPNSKDSI